MIKLNNKNITYVAFADSSNSIKAPKEIWYADSSNTVKLVYRRKDALIEGEDYEKYHWLDGDGSAYIDTLHSASEDLDWATKVADLTDGKALFWDRDGDGYAANMNVMIARTNDYRIGVRIANNSNEILLNPFPSSFTVQTNGASITIDGQSYSIIKNAGFNRNIKLFQSLSFADTNGVKCAYFRFIDTNSITTQNLIPCKLLKPVPKWLDANGIRRQVGECGMIDLISGKFYGNVNSNGTFTVENYYERKEWLVGDGSAYIDTGHNVNEDLDYETKAYLLPNTYLFWYRSGRPYVDQTIVARSNTSTYIGTRTAKNSTDVRIGNTANVEVQWNNNKVSVNGVNYTPDDRAITFNYELYMFYAYLADCDSPPPGYSSNDVKCAYFRFLDSNRNYIQNLTPCTLTMDLPASMDANNIARTKGTSGMWDLVSDRFYGNVNNSGTFKAVNLAEGVDYEVHQWLKTGSGNPYIQVVNEYNTDNDAYLETTFKGASVNGDADIILGFGSDNSFGYRIFVGGQIVNLDIHKRVNGVLASKRINIQSKPYQVCHILLNSNRYEFNGMSNTYELGDGFDSSIIKKFTRIFTNQNNNDMHYAETKLRVNNIEYDLIPVKLLRSIPAKYDANGIARQAGECGMYDTVNDVFYGNVASSGTFTVEDDN